MLAGTRKAATPSVRMTARGYELALIAAGTVGGGRADMDPSAISQSAPSHRQL